jgi:outer membrane protein TolC
MRRKTALIILISIIFSPCLIHARALRYSQTIGPNEIIDRVTTAAPETLIVREDLGQVEASYLGSKSVFDTKLAAEANYTRNEFARSSAFFGTRDDETNWNIGLAKKLPFGTSAAMDWTNQRAQLFGVPVIGGTTVFPTVPTYESVLQFSVAQPLMKNFAGLNDRSDVAAAKKELTSADLLSKYQIATIAHQALSYYWQWVVSYAFMSSWGEAVSNSVNFLNITLERKRLGTVEETDVLAARANLIGRRNGMIRARRRVILMETELRKVLGYPEDDHYSPRDKYPRYIQKIYTNKDSAIYAALENRWDYLAEQEEVERQNIKVVSSKNKRWPELDLVGTLAVNNLTSSYSRTMGGVSNPLYMVGATFSIPLENRAARAEYKQARHEKAKAVINLKKMENDISNDIAELFKRIQLNKKILNNSRSQVRMQRDKLHLEVEKYRMGRSNSEFIVLYQNDLLSGELVEFDAWADYLQSVLDLKLADNTLIDL